MTATHSGNRSPSSSKPDAWLERLSPSLAPAGPETSPLERSKRLAEALLSERGEASGAVVARELQEALRGEGEEDKLAFHRFLALGFLPDGQRLRAAAEAYLAKPTAETAARIAEAAEPPRQELLRRMNMAPGGTGALVAMRKTL